VSGSENVAQARELLKKAAARRRFTRTPLGEWSIRVVVLVGILLLWELFARDLPRALTAPPSEIAAAAWRQLFVTGEIWGPLGSSLTILVTGLATAIVIGIPVGVAMGRYRVVANALDPYVTFFYSIPNVALVPALIILVGFNTEFRFTYVVLASIWPIIINTMAGVRAVDTNLLDAGIAYTAKERQLVGGIVLPSASPFMVAGGRQAFTEAWSAVIVGEATTTLVGVGGMVELFAQFYLTADMFVPIFAIMIVGVIIQGLTAWAQQKLTPWQQVQSTA
jgi:ABC-type nitrate/sulfonate/bicarbonate transport system permease component